MATDTQRLRILRQQAGFSQARMAEAIGLAERARFSEWEAGKRSPSSKYIRPWADALKIDPDQLLALLGL